GGAGGYFSTINVNGNSVDVNGKVSNLTDWYGNSTVIQLPRVGPNGMLFDSTGGTSLGNCDDCNATVNLSFAFPFFSGSTSVISPGSNYLIWMGSNGNAQCCSFSTLPTSDGMGKIAIYHTDGYTGSGSWTGKGSSTEYVVTYSMTQFYPGAGNMN